MAEDNRELSPEKLRMPIRSTFWDTEILRETRLESLDRRDRVSPLHFCTTAPACVETLVKSLPYAAPVGQKDSLWKQSIGYKPTPSLNRRASCVFKNKNSVGDAE